MTEMQDGTKSRQVYKLLMDRVLSGDFASGDRLSEARLARDFGVSRSPVRTAISRLEHDGLLQRQGMVVTVRTRDIDEIIDIYRVRVKLEGMIARDAASNRQETDLLRLEAAFEAEGKVDSSDAMALVVANRKFHEALAAAARSVTLQSLQERLMAQIATQQRTTLMSPGRAKEAHREHRDILEVVRARDSEAAQRLAEAHLQRALDIRLDWIRKDFS